MDDPKVTHFVRAGGERRPSDGCYLPALSDGRRRGRRDRRLFLRQTAHSVRCATLEEVGTFDKKYGMTPIGYAHSCGLLGKGSFVSGCVYLDKDDIGSYRLFGNARHSHSVGQPGARLPAFPPLRMLHTLGAAVSLGTGSGTFKRECRSRVRTAAHMPCGKRYPVHSRSRAEGFCGLNASLGRSFTFRKSSP